MQVDVERYVRDGFLRFERLAEADDVAALRDVYDRLLSGAIEAPTDRKLGGITRQIMNVWQYDPVFRENSAFRAGREIASALLGVDEPEPVFDMLIYKEPGQLATTPWHQDFAYQVMPFTPAGRATPWRAFAQFWVALDDVDEQNGCMHFVPGVHRDPLKAHHVASGAPDYEGRLLAMDDAARDMDLTTAVACPLPAGGATVHSYGTPHFTPGNTTADRQRRAYIFNFANPGRSRAA